MGETGNLAKIGELVSDDLFEVFRWTSVGPRNENWQCVDPAHQKKPGQIATHPSDVVFYYDEPYAGHRTYVNCDLKSYAQATITAQKITGAIESLARSLTCAQKSDQWQSTYLHQNVTPQINGLLFVYNHDNDFDRNFQELLKEVDPQKLKIPKGSRLFVMGPDLIYWLNNVKQDILVSRAKKFLPDAHLCNFFHPDLVRKKIVQPRANAATLEVLTSPWIVLEYLNADGHSRKGIDIYYRGNGDSVDEFSYLIDWLLRCSIVRNDTKVRVKTFETVRTSPAAFQIAIQQYADDCAGKSTTLGAQEMRARLETIVYESMTSVVPTFSSLEIGMQRD